MVFNATSNNISVISWRPDLLVKENGVPGENHRTFASHLQTVSHNVVSSTPHLSQEVGVHVYPNFTCNWHLFSSIKRSTNFQLILLTQKKTDKTTMLFFYLVLDAQSIFYFLAVRPHLNVLRPENIIQYLNFLLFKDSKNCSTFQGT